jgi:ATP-dependent exoDNAse (exonuclease V) alpha subunit
MSIQYAIRLTDTWEQFNIAQRRAVEEVLTSRDTIQGLQGVAGSGRSSTLAAIREGAEEQGYTVEGFAPASRGSHQFRAAGISADTLQGFLARANPSASDPASRHLYMVAESSLASTRQMRDFLGKIGSEDRVLLIGDSRRYQGTGTGKLFEQLVQAGMRTAQVEQIERQKNPLLPKSVEHLSKGEVAEGITLLQQQGRVSEVADPQQRIAAMAKNYAALPDNTIIVSPDNASRREINQAVRGELQAIGIVHPADHTMRVLAPRSDVTGADRTRASSYHVGDVLHYQQGSKVIGIGRRGYAEVIATNPNENLLTVQKPDGAQLIYNPSSLFGISAYREIERQFAVGDRLQFTAPNHELGVASRDLGTIAHIAKDGQLAVRMDSGKTVKFDTNEMRHFDHGYAVTSLSSRGFAAERVLVNIDTDVHPEMINSRFAYVSISRASHDARIYTNNAVSLVPGLSQNATETSALEIGKAHDALVGIPQGLGKQEAHDIGAGLSL